jgi:hypothetical protein
MRADGALQPPFPAIGVVHTKDDRALETPSFTQRSPGRFLRQEEEPPRSMGYSGRFSGSNGASSAKLEISRTRNGRLVEELLATRLKPCRRSVSTLVAHHVWALPAGCACISSPAAPLATGQPCTRQRGPGCLQESTDGEWWVQDEGGRSLHPLASGAVSISAMPRN